MTGTHPGTTLNALSTESLREVGIDISAQRPKALTDDLIARADLVVVLGRDAQVQAADGTRVEVWDTDEPSLRGIDGMQRMRLVRDDIAARIHQLLTRLN